MSPPAPGAARGRRAAARAAGARQQNQPRIDHHHGRDEPADTQRGELQQVLVGRADGLGEPGRRTGDRHGPRDQRRVDREEHQEPCREHEDSCACRQAAAQPGHRRRRGRRGQHEHRRRVRLPVRRHPRPDRAPPQVPVHDDRAEPCPSRRQQGGCREEPDRRHVDVHLADQRAAAGALGVAAQLGVERPPRRRAGRRAQLGRGVGPRGGSSSPQTTNSAAQDSTASSAVTSGAGRLQSFQRRRSVRGALCDMRVLIVGGNQSRARTRPRRPIRGGLVRLPSRRSGYPRADLPVGVLYSSGCAAWFPHSESLLNLPQRCRRVSALARWPRGSAPDVRRRTYSTVSAGGPTRKGGGHAWKGVDVTYLSARPGSRGQPFGTRCRREQVGHMGDLVDRADGTPSVAADEHPGDARVVEREHERRATPRRCASQVLITPAFATTTAVARPSWAAATPSNAPTTRRVNAGTST